MIRFNEDDIPDAIVYISSAMRENLIRYGDILFLGTQKKQCTKMCWPYIAPVVLNNENEICCVRGSI